MRSLPAIQVGRQVFEGEAGVEQAVRCARGAALKANRAFDLIVSRGGLEPAFLADRDRLDRIEVVSVDDGEMVLYWEPAGERRLASAKALRTDLVGMDAEEFVRTWAGADE